MDICGLLRESAELIAVLHSLSKHSGDYGVDLRISDLMNRSEIILQTIRSFCGEEVYVEYSKYLSGMCDEEVLRNLLIKLNDCMIKNGCVSNISLEEE